MYCSKCGHEISDNSRFCAECGFSLLQHTESSSIINGLGTRDQSKENELIYPRNPPLSPYLCFVNLLVIGLAQIIFGQVAKGWIIILSSGTFFLLTKQPMIWFLIAIASTIDAYMIGSFLKKGLPVGKWAFFPNYKVNESR